MKIIFLGLLLGGLASCASYKNHLPEGENLYVGSKLNVTDSAIEERKLLEETLQEAIRPKQNKKVLGVRFKLGVYNTAGEPKTEKGLRNYLRTKIGEPPVLGSSFNLNRNEQIISNKLKNNGYFDPIIKAERIVDSNARKVSGKFEIIAGKRKFFESVDFMSGDSSVLAKEIQALSEGSFIKKGNPYFLQTITDERDRIDLELKNKGFYYFSPDYLLARIDTGLNADSLAVHFELKKEVIEPKVADVYHIKDVIVNPNYSIRVNKTNDAETKKNSDERRRLPNVDTINYEFFQLVQRKKEQFKPFLFKNAIHFKPGDLYSRKVQNISLNRLVSLNAFKFIKNDMEETYDSTGRPLLNAIYLLTPYPSKSLNLETSAFSQNDSRVGSRISIGWKHRNILKGAEQLDIKLSGGFEFQYGGEVKRPNLYQGGIEANLVVPRLLFARSLGVNSNSSYIPKTNIKLGYNYYLSQKAYTLNTFNFGFGYQWKESAKKEHKLYPLNITYVKTDTIGSTADFNLSNILFNGIIIGPTYEFTYNSQVLGRKDLNFYFNGLADLSATTIGLAQGAKIGEPTKKILGSAYAQYLKAQTDFRIYKSFGKESIWASRLFLGAGYSYGNSTSLPNVKQFFVGGASSLRGFRSRILGPGSFHQDTLPTNQQFLELLGDIKMEANTEIRVPLYGSWLKGAVFADAGNIWLQRPRADMPGGAISKDFLKDIAVSAGLGLRFDFSILVLRTDFGMPIRKPWVSENGGWVFNQIDFGSALWRRNNIIFNLAIGYPF